ncbi:MAG: hypothetical protein Q8O86_10165, partial [Dehalococcoidia bacterium]|nr:hypothetical protein [Dehalococcoidia bacterium]
LALHDPPLAASLWKADALPFWQPLQVANSIVNTVVILTWTVLLAVGPGRERASPKASVPASTLK